MSIACDQHIIADLHVLDEWHFRAAGWAPGCPEVHQHWFTPEIIEGNRLSIDIIELKIRSQVTNLRTSNGT